jgi:hypothetical protein
VIGEYVGKIYLEAKQRPRFLIAETLAGAGVSERPALQRTSHE